MEKKTCKTCEYFRRHYIQLSRNYFAPTEFGHCEYPGKMKCGVDFPACKKHKDKTGGVQ